MKKYYSMKILLFGFLVYLVSCNQSAQITTPESVGLSSDTLELASIRMQEYIDSGKLAGISTLVMKNGKVVRKEFFGHASLEHQKLVEENTIFRIFSMSKPVTTVALMILFDEEKFELDDKVSKYIPEFEGMQVYKSDGENHILEPQVEEMTIRHLLTHTSGISYGWNQKSIVDSLYRVNKVGSWDQTIGEQVKLLSEMPLNFQPGTKWEYGLSIDVAGYLVEVLSGMPLDTYFKTRIFDPLKMPDTGFYVPEDQQERLTELYFTDSLGNLKSNAKRWGDAFKKPPVIFSGGGGLVSTLNDYSRFCSMMLNGGQLDGLQLLKESTVKLIMSDQLPDGTSYAGDNGYGLGGSVNLKSGEYGWAGAASTKFWIDPANQLIVITYAQLMPSDYTYADEFKDIVKRALLHVN